MAEAVISCGGESVSIPLLGAGNELAAARDRGKPTINFYDTGTEAPKVGDHLGGGDAFTFAGLLHGSNAYSDAKTLAELIKQRATTGTPLQLDLSDLPNKGTYDVAPVTSTAVVLAYVPGRRLMVGVQATLNVVGNTVGSTGDPTQTVQSNLTADAGSGIKLTDGSNSVTLTHDLEVVRKVGRPNGDLTPRPLDLPLYNDKNDPASDVFEISGELTGPNAEADAKTLAETLIGSRLGFGSLELHFQSGLFGLDAFTVITSGSQAVRTVFNTGTTGVVSVPKLALRVAWDQNRPEDVTEIGANS